MKKDIIFGGLSNSVDEYVVPNDRAWLNMNTQTDEDALTSLEFYGLAGNRANAASGDVGYGLAYGKWSGNERVKLRATGNPTGGTWTIEYDGPESGAALNQTTGNLDWDATAQDVYTALVALAGIGPNDVVVTGGAFPGTPIEIEFTGALANTNIRVLVCADALTGGTTPAVEVTTVRNGGDHEVMYAVVKHDGDTDANLYAITSSDGFDTTTWTSIATTMDASDWFFQQFEDKMFMANAVDGLRYIYIGTTSLIADPPDAPVAKPNFGGPFTDTYQVPLGTFTWTQSGFGVAPTFTALNSHTLQVTLNGTESGRRVVMTGALSSGTDDLSDQDLALVTLFTGPAGAVRISGMEIAWINDDGSPLTIEPLANQMLAQPTAYNFDHFAMFAGSQRSDRDNIKKWELTFTIDAGVSTNTFLLTGGRVFSNWLNDTLAFDLGDGVRQPNPVKDTFEVGMTYYRVSDGAESKLSPTNLSPQVPANLAGSYVSVNGVGTPALSSGDYQFFYRRDKLTGKWHRLPNLTTKAVAALQLTDYGVPNDPTGAQDGHYTHHWEYELEQFPELQNFGFPPTDTGAKAECIAAWKQCLVVGSARQCYLSWVGQPLRFEPSPDQPNYTAPDPEDFPDVGSTEYVSDDRAESVMGFVGQDSCYAATRNAIYAKVGDSPAESTVFRRLPGSRGVLGRRSFVRYGGGILIASTDGAWYYSVGRGFSGEDNGALAEREETKDVRQSYRRLLSTLMTMRYETNVTGGSFVLSINGEVTPELDWDATPLDIQRSIENAAGCAPGDVEVWATEDMASGGTVYMRWVGQYAGKAGPTVTVNTLGLEGDSPAIEIETITAGGGSSVVVREYDDAYWFSNSRSFLYQSRNRKWQEGVFADSVKEMITPRDVGLFFLTTTGRLMQIREGLNPPDVVNPRWYYESPWMIGPRLQVVGILAHVRGAPKLRFYMDDGENGVTHSDHTLTHGKRAILGAYTKPGVAVKIAASGRFRVDSIKKLMVEVDPIGEEYGS